MTFDWFDFDDKARIVEHWDVIAPWSDDLPSGRTSTDGATDVIDLDRTEENRAVVHWALNDLLMPGGDRDSGLALIAEEYLQHSREVPDGRDALAALVQSPDSSLAYRRIARSCAMGTTSQHSVRPPGTAHPTRERPLPAGGWPDHRALGRRRGNRSRGGLVNGGKF